MAAEPSTEASSATVHKDHSSRGPTYIGVLSALQFLVMASVGIRMCSRYLIRQLANDDWCVFAASVLFTGSTITQIYGTVEWGWGRHEWDIPPRPPAQKYPESYVRLIYRLAFYYMTTLVRLSICLFLLRINPYNKLRIVLRCFVVFHIIWMIGLTLHLFFRCSPVKESIFWVGGWGSKGAKCTNERVGSDVIIATQLALDLITWMMPIAVVKKVMVSRKQKIQIIMLLCVGLLACVAAAVRLPLTHAMGGSTDISWDAVLPHTAAAFEAGIGIISASVPAVKKFLSNSKSVKQLSNAFSSTLHRLPRYDQSLATKEEGGVKVEVVVELRSEKRVFDDMC